MKIFIASDHAGFELKKFLVKELTKAGHDMVDCGAHELVEGDDYPTYISKAAKDVSEAESALLTGDIDPDIYAVRGIVIGGSGQGEAIVANRYPHVRAAVFYGGEKHIADQIIKLSREHNDANILSLGARFISEDQALEAVNLWLDTDFSGNKRHTRRIHEIDEYPSKDQGLFNI